MITVLLKKILELLQLILLKPSGTPVWCNEPTKIGKWINGEDVYKICIHKTFTLSQGHSFSNHDETLPEGYKFLSIDMNLSTLTRYASGSSPKQHFNMMSGPVSPNFKPVFYTDNFDNVIHVSTSNVLQNVLEENYVFYAIKEVTT